MARNSRNCNFVITDKTMLGDFWSDKEVMTKRLFGKGKFFYRWWMTFP